MTIDECLREATNKLAQASVASARLDAMLLCADVLQKPKAWLIAHGDVELTSAQTDSLAKLLARRVSHEPIAYILSRSEFYGREFEVSADTLQPRPETETLVEMCLAHFRNEERGTRNEECVVVDVGTGSGCIAVTLALELGSLSTRNSELGTIYATDISKKALAIAKRNAKKHSATILFHQGNLIEPLLPELRTRNSELLIVANLPYVPIGHTINEAARHEPDIAIFGGNDGLDYYREMFAQLSIIQDDIPYITVLTESLPPQHEILNSIAESYGFRQIGSQDFIQVFLKTL